MTDKNTAGAHHLTPDNITATIKDLREIEDGTTLFPVGGRDLRTMAGVLARTIEHLARRAEPSVAADERALFEAWMSSLPTNADPHYLDVWMARAALASPAVSQKDGAAVAGYSKEWSERMLEKELSFGGNIEAGATTASASDESTPIGYVTQDALHRIVNMGTDQITFHTTMIRNKPSRDAVLPIYSRAPAPSRDASQKGVAIVGHTELNRFMSGYCNGKPELMACAQAAMFFFNECARAALARAPLPGQGDGKKCQYPNCGCTSRATCNFNYDAQAGDARYAVKTVQPYCMGMDCVCGGSCPVAMSASQDQREAK